MNPYHNQMPQSGGIPRDLDPSYSHAEPLNVRVASYLERELPDITRQPGGPQPNQMQMIANVYELAANQANTVLSQHVSVPGNNNYDALHMRAVAYMIAQPGEFPVEQVRKLLESANDRELVKLYIANAMIGRINTAAGHEAELASLPTAFNGILRLLGGTHATMLRAYLFGATKHQRAARVGEIAAAERQEAALRLAEQKARADQATQDAADRKQQTADQARRDKEAKLRHQELIRLQQQLAAQQAQIAASAQQQAASAKESAEHQRAQAEAAARTARAQEAMAELAAELAANRRGTQQQGYGQAENPGGAESGAGETPDSAQRGRAQSQGQARTSAEPPQVRITELPHDDPADPTS